MSTIAEIADLAQRTLADTAGSTWIQATVEEWVKEAVRDYSNYFHRTRRADISAALADHDYDLPDDLLEIVSVEYPQGSDPPEYLTRRSHLDPDFWLSGEYYSFVPSYAGSNEEPVLVISAAPAGTETIRVTYNAAYYDVTASPPDANVYVPDHHVPILVHFVAWKAATERIYDEMQHPDRTYRIIGDMQQAAEAAHATYLKMITGAREAAAPSQITNPWTVDTYDPIY